MTKEVSEMSSKIIAAVAAVASAGVAAALLVGGPAAAAAKNTVAGKVGPGYTISLTLGGKKVKTLKAGVKYRFVVADRSEDHDFRLKGPGVNKMLSGEEFIGTKTTMLTLKKGTYRFYCAPHAEDMRGGFTVS
jgi:plastocyanin